MANEIAGQGITGATAYFRLFNNVNQIWNTAGTPAFEAYNAANITDYDIAMTELGATGYYAGSMPSVAAGAYSAVCYYRAGGSPAQSDTPFAGGDIQWSGSVVEALSSLLHPTTAGRTLDVTTGGAAGIDWSNVENPTTSLNLSATTIAVTQQVDVNTIKTQTVTCAAGVTIRTDVGAAAAPGAANGMLIGGSNAATTFAGLTTGALSCTTVTTSGLVTFHQFTCTNAFTVGGAFAVNSVLVINDVDVSGNLLVSGTSTFTGAFMAANNGNDIDLGAAERALIAAAVMASTVETGISLTQAVQIIGATTAGKSTGGPANPIYVGLDGSTARVSGTADADGNRSAATYNV